MAAPERLSAAALKAVNAGPHVLSVLTYWEVILKSASGKLDVGDPRVWWETALADFAATALPLRSSHVTEIHHLAAIHRDPFDRALIAQATVEDLTLVTTDDTITKYTSGSVRIIR
jgi:PIN domain nuclease of toxin-antitoxin system